jgi:hypothetical protein
MNVQLLPAALADVAVLRGSGYRGSGFLLGAAIGRFVLVEKLLPLDFDPRSGGDAACAAAFREYGERLQGVFFCRRRPIALDWSVGDLVLALRQKDIQAFTCEFDSSRRRVRLAPLLEETEERWQS